MEYLTKYHPTPPGLYTQPPQMHHHEALMLGQWFPQSNPPPHTHISPCANQKRVGFHCDHPQQPTPFAWSTWLLCIILAVNYTGIMLLRWAYHFYKRNPPSSIATIFIFLQSPTRLSAPSNSHRFNSNPVFCSKAGPFHNTDGLQGRVMSLDIP